MNIAKRNQRITRMIATCLVLLVIAILAFTSCSSLWAIPAPTATPQPTTQHWELLNDGDTAYLLTNPNCSLITEEYGGGARKLTLECDPVKGE